MFKLYKLINWYNCKKHNVHMGEASKMTGVVHFHGCGPIMIGKDVSIVSGEKYNPTVGEGSTHFRVWAKAKLVIKDHAGISNTSISAREYVEIGEGVAIGAGCVIMDLDFHSVDPADRGKYDDLGKVAPVIIKKGAFIGAKSTILKGVTIGEHAVIGACSVVTCDIPDNEIWAGNPAHFVRKLRM